MYQMSLCTVIIISSCLALICADKPIVIVVQSGASVLFSAGAAVQSPATQPLSPVDTISAGNGYYPPLNNRDTAWQRDSNSSVLRWLHQVWDNTCPVIHTFIAKQYAAAQQYVQHNAWDLWWKGSLASYVYINYRLFRSITYLLDPERWIYWHHDLTLAQLLMWSDAELLDNMVAVVNAGRAKRATYDCISIIQKQLSDEIRMLERYGSWARGIMLVDNVQRSCGVFCEGYLPKIAGFSIGCIIRIALQAISIKHLLYIHEGLVRSAPDYLRRLYHLKRCIDEYSLSEARCSADHTR